jgi:hypothetical protein
MTARLVPLVECGGGTFAALRGLDCIADSIADSIVRGDEPQDDLRSIDLHVARVLASFLSHDGCSCWPSVRTIMNRTLLSERAVQGAFRRLNACRIVSVERRTGPNGRASTCLFTFTWGAREPSPDGVHLVRGEGAPGAGGRVHEVRGEGAPGAPDPEKGSGKKDLTTPPRRVPGAEPPAAGSAGGTRARGEEGEGTRESAEPHVPPEAPDLASGSEAREGGKHEQKEHRRAPPWNPWRSWRALYLEHHGEKYPGDPSDGPAMGRLFAAALEEEPESAPELMEAQFRAYLDDDAAGGAGDLSCATFGFPHALAYVGPHARDEADLEAQAQALYDGGTR